LYFGEAIVLPISGCVKGFLPRIATDFSDLFFVQIREIRG
jgi:hypothetical protein